MQSASLMSAVNSECDIAFFWKERVVIQDKIHSSQIVPGPPDPEAVAYLFNHGGLNNQKMALVGLVLRAVQQRRPINLPYIYLKDQRTVEEDVVTFAQIFDKALFQAFARKEGIEVCETPPGGERGGWDDFRRFSSTLLDPPDQHVIEMILRSLTSLRPMMLAVPVYQDLRRFVFASMKIQTVIQLRIEDDWVNHAKALRPTMGDVEDYDIGFLEILAKIRKTFPLLDAAYVTADETSMPICKEEIRSLARSRFNLSLVWKSDFLPRQQFETMHPFELSIIDFEIAKTAPHFIGMSNSTFSNMACLEKFAQTRNAVTGHFIYNHPGDVVIERKDNGFTAAAHLAVCRSAAEMLLADNQTTRLNP